MCCNMFDFAYLLGMDADELSNAINNDGEDGVESFEKLFSKLQLMKGM